jgi:hypothetical protein
LLLSGGLFQPRSTLPRTFINFINSLPQEVMALDFRSSNFFEKADANTKLPEHLTELGFDVSLLRSERRTLLNGLTQLKVIKLNLLPYDGNHKDSLNFIPSSVTTLDLSHNQLGNFNLDELFSLLSKLPKHIRMINLDNNGLFHRCKTIAEADELFKKIQEALPVHPRYGKPTVHLNKGNGYSAVSQYGLLLTPRNITRTQGELLQLPHGNARLLINHFLGGGETLVGIEPYLEPILATNPISKPAFAK